MIGKAAWAVVSVALAFGLNTQLRPRFEAPYERGEARVQAGVLALEQPTGALELPTYAAHAIAADVPRAGKVFEVRELSLRSLQAPDGVLSFELFASLPAALGAVPGLALVPTVLRGVELELRPLGRLGARESFVQRQAGERGRVLTGSWLFTDINLAEAAEGAAPVYQGQARLELQIETERGVDMVTAKWSGRLIWE